MAPVGADEGDTGVVTLALRRDGGAGVRQRGAHAIEVRGELLGVDEVEAE